MKPFIEYVYDLLEWSTRNYQPPFTAMKLSELIPIIGLKFVGRHEFPKGSNSGPDIQEFFDADSFDPNGSKPGDYGYAWCASFGCRVVQLAMQSWLSMNPGKTLTFVRPTSASVFAWEGWSLAQDDSTKTLKRNLDQIHKDTVKRGDILLLSVSHFAIATSDADSNGRFETVEGNTNDDGSREGWLVVNKVGNKKRSYKELKTIIRFTV